MKKIDDKLITRIAELAKLEFNTEALKKIKKDLKKILAFVEKLNEIDTKKIDPLIYINEETNICREDEIKEVYSQVDVLQNAPEKDSDYFKVPTVLKK